MRFDYARFRGSRWFLLALCLAITAAMGAHRLLGFDPDWGLTNLALSMEASISVALLIMANERQEAAEARQEEAEQKRLLYMLHLLEATHELLSLVHGGLKGHAPDDGCVDAPDRSEAAD